MNKYLLYFLLTFFLIFSSCKVKKKTSNVSSTQQKLEMQFNIFKGVPYKYGGSNKRGFDCSGLTQVVYNNAFQINLPRTTEEMGKLGKKVSKQNLLPGDLVFFKPSRKYKHVGIFMGDDFFMHSSTSKGVIKSNLNNNYWEKKYKYAKRILKTN